MKRTEKRLKAVYMKRMTRNIEARLSKYGMFDRTFSSKEIEYGILEWAKKKFKGHSFIIRKETVGEGHMYFWTVTDLVAETLRPFKWKKVYV